MATTYGSTCCSPPESSTSSWAAWIFSALPGCLAHDSRTSAKDFRQGETGDRLDPGTHQSPAASSVTAGAAQVGTSMLRRSGMTLPPRRRVRTPVDTNQLWAGLKHGSSMKPPSGRAPTP